MSKQEIEHIAKTYDGQEVRAIRQLQADVAVRDREIGMLREAYTTLNDSYKAAMRDFRAQIGRLELAATAWRGS